MTTAQNARPDPLVALLVYGCPTGPEFTQASWFRAEDREAAKAAAEALNFAVIDLNTEEEKALARGVHEGTLKGSGRMIVGAVSSEVYRRIDEYMRNRADASAVGGSDAAQESGSVVKEQTVNRRAATGTPPPSGHGAGANPSTLTAAWDALAAGSHVLALSFNDEGEPEGWWPATITKIDRRELSLRWDDVNFQRSLQHVAILHPDFVASDE